MKKNTSEKLINLLGVAAGNAILALAVVAFIVPAGIPMGGSEAVGKCKNLSGAFVFGDVTFE